MSKDVRASTVRAFPGPLCRRGTYARIVMPMEEIQAIVLAQLGRLAAEERALGGVAGLIREHVSLKSEMEVLRRMKVEAGRKKKAAELRKRVHAQMAATREQAEDTPENRRQIRILELNLLRTCDPSAEELAQMDAELKELGVDVKQ